MKLPADCPYTEIPPGRLALGAIDLAGCCRGHTQTWLVRNEEPLCRTLGSEAEVYRFIWRSSFDGDASVRVGCQGDAITLRWQYDWFRAPAADDAPAEAALLPADWAGFREALIAAKFWALDPIDEAQGLDGAEWLIDGRHGNIYQGVTRWSPQGTLHDLGRLFFALAGPPLSKVKLY